MEILILADDPISLQARTYAEYRLFAALSQLPFAGRVRHATVELRAVRRKQGGDGVSCIVTVGVEEGGEQRIRATGGHAYAAINRAIERLGNAGALVRRRAATAEHASE